MSFFPNLAGAAATSSAPAYTGPVASGCSINDSTFSATYQGMSRNAHYARDNISTLQIVLQNFQGFESSTGGSATFTATVEYPTGTILGRFTFGGSNTGTSATSPSVLISDILSLSTVIPNGALFFTRIWCSFAGSSFPYLARGNSILGEGCQIAGTTTDLTGGGTVAYYNFSIRPLALLSNTSKATVACIGDSRTNGYADVPDITGDQGDQVRSLGGTLACLNLGILAALLSNFISTHTLRLQIANYCSHVTIHFGINDLNASQAVTTVESNLVAAGNLFSPAKRVFICTVPPIVTSSDSYATESNQTTSVSTSTLNDYIRQCVSPFSGVIDLADAVETARNSGIWFVNGKGTVAAPAGQRPTSDGVHELPFMLNRIKSKGTFNPALFTRA